MQGANPITHHKRMLTLIFISLVDMRRTCIHGNWASHRIAMHTPSAFAAARARSQETLASALLGEGEFMDCHILFHRQLLLDALLL